MPYIMNALETPLRTQAHGQWFVFKPGQIKEIQNRDLALFMAQSRGEDGLVMVDTQIIENNEPTSAEYKEHIEEKRREGIASRIKKLDWVIRNLRESLRYDLQTKGIKTDSLAFASKGELAAIKERMALQEYEKLEHLNVAEEARKMLEKLDDGSGSNPEPAKNNPGRENTSQPAKSGK